MPPAPSPDPGSGRGSLGPLAGLLVIDCSTVLAGPYCTMLLGDLGADVVKVEPPEGDSTRGWGPPWVGLEVDGTRTAAYYLAINRNKRSLRLDLKTSEGAAVLTKLLERGDVVIENLRVGGFARLGFDDETLRRLNPGLVHLAITGFGPDGPSAALPGYDFVIQAVSGLMSITGAPDAEGGQPTKVGVAISDVVTGMLGAVSVLAALLDRERASEPAGSHGQKIDISLFGATLASLVNQAQNTFVEGRSPGRLGNAHPNIVPYETIETADHPIAVAIGSERQWQRFCQALERPELATDPRFASNADRVIHRAELRRVLVERFREHTAAAWLAVLDGASIPCGPINDIAGAFASDEAAVLGMTVEQTHPAWGVIRQVGIPFRLSKTPASIRTTPPALGEHTDEVLGELGYTALEIAGFRERGVV